MESLYFRIDNSGSSAPETETVDRRCRIRLRLEGMHKYSLNTASRRGWVTRRHFLVFQRSVTDKLRTLQTSVARMRGKVHELETTLDPLVDHVASTERELQDLQARVTRLEHRRPR